MWNKVILVVELIVLQKRECQTTVKMDFSGALRNKIDTIVKNWVEAVHQDGEIESTKELTYKGIRDGIPYVLEAIATILSQSEANDLNTLIDKSLEHGVIRAEQGFDAKEIAREYRLLRQVIFSNLETDLLMGTPQEILRTVRQIDSAIDEVITRCFESYVEERLKELQQLYNQLILTNQELTRLVQSHQDNLSHLAHELKNPLTSIIGYSNLFLRQQRKNIDLTDSSSNVEHIERVLKNGRQLLHLINDALEVSRYQAGKIKLHLMPIDVRSLIEDVIEVLEPSASAKGLKTIVDCEKAPAQVLTDPLRLQQIITNLVSNAIRYTESGTVKVVSQMLNDNQWLLSVSDTGIGIAPVDQASIFEPFYQASKNGSKSPESTGLGLTIVSQLVELLQGKIELVSDLGVGSTFTVILPLQVKSVNKVLT